MAEQSTSVPDYSTTGMFRRCMECNVYKPLKEMVNIGGFDYCMTCYRNKSMRVTNKTTCPHCGKEIEVTIR